MAPKKKFMDALAELSGDESDSDGGSLAEVEDEMLKVAAKKTKIDLQDLERCGYKSGPSVLLMPAPKEAQTSSWAWDSGASQKRVEPEEQSEAERKATRDAVTTDLSTSVGVAKKAWDLKEQQHQARRDEREAMRDRLYSGNQKRDGDKDGKSFNQKEKRKRDAGQASRGKNFVEEEKRLGRSLGMFSGFD